MFSFPDYGKDSRWFSGALDITDAPALKAWSTDFVKSRAEARRIERENEDFAKFNRGLIVGVRSQGGEICICYTISSSSSFGGGRSESTHEGGEIAVELLIAKGAMTRAEADAIHAECEAKQFQSPSNSQTCPSSESLPTPRAATDSLSPEAAK